MRYIDVFCRGLFPLSTMIYKFGEKRNSLQNYFRISFLDIKSSPQTYRSDHKTKHILCFVLCCKEVNEPWKKQNRLARIYTNTVLLRKFEPKLRFVFWGQQHNIASSTSVVLNRCAVIFLGMPPNLKISYIVYETVLISSFWSVFHPWVSPPNLFFQIRVLQIKKGWETLVYVFVYLTYLLL